MEYKNQASTFTRKSIKEPKDSVLNLNENLKNEQIKKLKQKK
jgi:hypothetical protein